MVKRILKKVIRRIRKIRNIGHKDISGIFYRRYNFCEGDQFKVFKNINDVYFPSLIYGNHKLTFDSVSRNLTLQYLECICCGLVCINPLTKFEDINKKSFDGERNIVAWKDFDYSFYEEDKIKFISSYYEEVNLEKQRKNNRILDVSCGPGVSLNWFRNEKKWDIYGIDPDLHSVRTAKNHYNVIIENGLIHDITTPDEYFDIVIMDNALEHYFDPLSGLVKAFSLLRKGGRLCIIVPNSEGLATKFLNENLNWGHWFCYSPKPLYKILQKIGFVVSGLIADQGGTVKQEIIDRGYNIEPYLNGLSAKIFLGEDIGRIEKNNFYADYFSLIADKPHDARSHSLREKELLAIANSSLEELKTVKVQNEQKC